MTQNLGHIQFVSISTINKMKKILFELLGYLAYAYSRWYTYLITAQYFLNALKLTSTLIYWFLWMKTDLHISNQCLATKICKHCEV